MKVSNGLTNQPMRALPWQTMTSKHLDLLEGFPGPHCVDVAARQVSQVENNPIPEYQVYFMTIVYLHVIEDNFRNPSTRALDYISVSTDMI